MITAEFKVNGLTIANIYCHNEQMLDFDVKNNTLCEYYYEFNEIGKNLLITGNIEHVREKGFEGLFEKILQDVRKKKKDV